MIQKRVQGDQNFSNIRKSYDKAANYFDRSHLSQITPNRRQPVWNIGASNTKN